MKLTSISYVSSTVIISVKTYTHTELTPPSYEERNMFTCTHNLHMQRYTYSS